MSIFYGSIRKKLILLVLFAVSPVLLILVGTEYLNKQHAVEEAEQEAARFLNGFVEIQKRVTDATHALLRTLASMPEIRAQDVAGARVLLSTLLETNPIYTNVILVDLDGNVVAAGRNHDRARHLNFSDRRQFKAAVAAKGFASGEFVVGKSSRKSIFPFGMAVLDHNGACNGAIIIGFSLDHYAALYDRGAYPENSFFGICDHQGRRLFRYPYSDRVPVGDPIKETVFQAATATTGPGSVKALASDGRERIIVFEPVRLQHHAVPYLYMFLGYDAKLIQTEANTILFRAAASGAVSLTLALAIAALVGGWGIARRVEKLTQMAKRFSQGEAGVSSGLDYGDGEIGTLAKSFDDMVLMLARQDRERTEALSRSSPPMSSTILPLAGKFSAWILTCSP